MQPKLKTELVYVNSKDMVNNPEGDFQMSLVSPIYNVDSVQVVQCSFPFAWNNINSDNYNIKMLIQPDNIYYEFQIPLGVYDSTRFLEILNTKFNPKTSTDAPIYPYIMKITATPENKLCFNLMGNVKLTIVNKDTTARQLLGMGSSDIVMDNLPKDSSSYEFQSHLSALKIDATNNKLSYGLTLYGRGDTTETITLTEGVYNLVQFNALLNTVINPTLEDGRRKYDKSLFNITTAFTPSRQLQMTISGIYAKVTLLCASTFASEILELKSDLELDVGLNPEKIFTLDHIFNDMTVTADNNRLVFNISNEQSNRYIDFPLGDLTIAQILSYLDKINYVDGVKLTSFTATFSYNAETNKINVIYAGNIVELRLIASASSSASMLGLNDVLLMTNRNQVMNYYSNYMCNLMPYDHLRIELDNVLCNSSANSSVQTQHIGAIVSLAGFKAFDLVTNLNDTSIPMASTQDTLNSINMRITTVDGYTPTCMYILPWFVVLKVTHYIA